MEIIKVDDVMVKIREFGATLPVAKKPACGCRVDIKRRPYTNVQKNILYIGEAGCGKSRHIKQQKLFALGTTGMSAFSISSRTLSSYFALGPTNEKCIHHVYKKTNWDFLEGGYLVIDEAYTLGLDIMTKLDTLLRLMLRDEVFGGLSIILYGDYAQLPSVSTPFIGSALYKACNFEVITLEYDPLTGRLEADYREKVNYLRSERSESEIMDFLTAMTFSKVELNGIHVFYTNDEVAAYNKMRMEREEEIVPIMYTRNYLRLGIYNGKIEYCKRINGKIYPTCSEVAYEIAYAITIHKVQGLTLDCINVHYGNWWSDRTKLLYVALSRVSCASKVYFTLANKV